MAKPVPFQPMALSQLAPEAALRRLELQIVRRLEGFLHGEHLGLLPGPGSDLAEARTYIAGEDDVRAALLEGNRAYEERFGHVYLIRAAGRSPSEMLAELRRRLDNDDASEREANHG